MKFTIEKNIIVENLANVVKAISAKNIIPILNGIKLELEDDGLYLTASDSELTIRSFIPNESINKVENKGSIIIQSKFILDIIRKLPSDLVNFELMDGLKIRISSDNSQYDLNCLDPKEYPSMKLEEKDKPIIIKGDIFNDTGLCVINIYNNININNNTNNLIYQGKTNKKGEFSIGPFYTYVNTTLIIEFNIEIFKIVNNTILTYDNNYNNYSTTLKIGGYGFNFDSNKQSKIAEGLIGTTKFFCIN